MRDAPDAQPFVRLAEVDECENVCDEGAGSTFVAAVERHHMVN